MVKASRGGVERARGGGSQSPTRRDAGLRCTRALVSVRVYSNARSALGDCQRSPYSYIPRHPLLYKPGFQTGRTLMARTLEAAGEIAAATVAEVVARMAKIVRVAIEGVATASEAETWGVERRLLQQMDAGTAEVKERVESRAERVVASTARAATPVNGHMDNHSNALEAELSQLREVL